jgi:pimeloyl-ACP methyl ester carboxylesterase
MSNAATLSTAAAAADVACKWGRPLFVKGADGVRLHAVAAGDSGPLLLFLHGFPECWLAWHRQLQEFGHDHTAVALDLRGYNRSDKPGAESAYELQRMVADVRAVIEALSPNRPAILVGHDWGGIIAWTLARESPELIARMVIINAPHPWLFYRELKQNPAQRTASSYAAFFQLRGVAEGTLQAFDFAAFRKMVFGGSARPRAFDEDLRRAYHDAWSQPGALTSSLNYYRNLRAFRRLLRAGGDWSIPVPTLVLWGEQDAALVSDNLRGLEDLVPQLTVKRHPTATHWVIHEDPCWVHESIRGFLGAR